jgi:hypothetical protein
MAIIIPAIIVPAVISPCSFFIRPIASPVFYLSFERIFIETIIGTVAGRVS